MCVSYMLYRLIWYFTVNPFLLHGYACAAAPCFVLLTETIPYIPDSGVKSAHCVLPQHERLEGEQEHVSGETGDSFITANAHGFLICTVFPKYCIFL